MSPFKSDGTLCLSWFSDRYTRIISLASPGQRKAHRVVAHSGPCICRCSLSWHSPRDPSTYKCHRNGNVSHGFLRIVHEYPPRSGISSRAMDEEGNVEKQLIDAFDRVAHQDHPNPNRVNCPGIAALRELASHPEQLRSASILAHIGHCAPCLDELKGLRASIHNHS